MTQILKQLDDVNPSFPPDNLADCLTLHAQRVRDGLMCFTLCGTRTDRAYKVISKFCTMVAHALLPSVSPHIHKICLAAIPSQIRKSVIHRIAVFMTSFLPRGAWPNECFEDEVVDIARTRSAELNHLAHVAISAAFTYDNTGSELPPFLAQSPAVISLAPHRSIAAYTIAWIFRNFPILDHASIVSLMGRRGVVRNGADS